MYFVSFPVSATNIFPIANSEAGGQYLSEYNLRSRETVATDPSVEYPIGPSYAHSEADFAIVSNKEDPDVASTAIQINPGRAIVNGHYVELLAPIKIDMGAVNYKASIEHVPTLKGELAIGLVMMYSTYQTLASSALPENEDGYYEGIRVVIVPRTEMKRPVEVPKEHQYSQVNMHLLLGTFTFYNGTISNVTIAPDKLKVLDASRVGDLSTSLSDVYLSKAGLDPGNLYVFSGKGTEDGVDGRDTWCAAQDSLMIWDTNPKLVTTPPSATVAHFEYNSVYDYAGHVKTGYTELVLPHKQVDGYKDSHGNPVYFPDKRYLLPNATFSLNSGGVVSPQYTERILHIEEMVNQYYRLPNGVMRKYIKELTISPTETTRYGESGALPIIPIAEDGVVSTVIEDIISTIASAVAEVQEVLVGSDSSSISRTIMAVASAVDAVSNDLRDDTGTIQTAIDNVLSSVSTDLATSKNKVDAAYDQNMDTYDAVTRRNYREAMTSITQTTSDLNAAKSAIASAIASVSSVSTSEIRAALNNQADALNNISSRISDIIGDSEEPADNTLWACSNKLDSVVADITNLRQLVSNYVDEEIDRRMDEKTVLKEHVWSPGDYILVAQDYTQPQSSDGSYPSTMYVVNYGQIETIGYVSKIQTTIPVDAEDFDDQLTLFRHKVPASLSGGVELAYHLIEKSSPSSTDISNLNFTQYYGAIRRDYFILHYEQDNYDEETNQLVSRSYVNYFYTPLTTSLQLTYLLPPIRVSGGVPVATEETIGGFLSVSESTLGQGYVRVDESGHLKVVDFDYLVMGIQAQQLGHSLSVGSGLGIDAINQTLDEYVNDRVCYPNAQQEIDATAEGKDPDVIELELYLPSSSEGQYVHIHDIDVRADSYLYVHIVGSATSDVTVVFENCTKLRIDDTIQGEPNLVFKNVNLYYSANVLDRAGSHSQVSTQTGIENLTLWYERDYEDISSPDLQVDGMTVTLLGDVEDTINFDPWDSENPNDNHYAYALRSLTFAGDGSICGFGLLVADGSTMNVAPGLSIFRSNFELPQNSGLAYPASKLTRRLKVSGSFVTCYWSTSDRKYILKDTNFSALTSNTDDPGSIAFCTNTQLVSHITGAADNETIDCWDLNSLHIFSGGAID